MSNKSLAFVFPGQGSQSVGMVNALAAQYPLVQETFRQASEVLGYDLMALVREGPEDTLNSTEKTQPALLTAGYATWRVWLEKGGPLPSLMAGHSLGEYTALVCSGSLAFTDAVSLVADRGSFMQGAVSAGTGAMAAILGLDDAVIVEICNKVSTDNETVAAANFNSTGQVVIAGHTDAVKRAVEEAGAAGARRSVILPVSVPSHCSLMQPAAEQLAARLSDIPIDAGTIPVIHNVDAATKSSGTAIKQALVDQLSRPVRWVDTIGVMAKQGAKQIVECGPGKVLCGLIKRIDRQIATLPVYDPDTVNTALVAIIEKAEQETK